MCLVSRYPLEIIQKAPQVFHANHYLFFTKACITNMVMKEPNAEAQAKYLPDLVTHSEETHMKGSSCKDT